MRDAFLEATCPKSGILHARKMGGPMESKRILPIVAGLLAAVAAAAQNRAPKLPPAPANPPAPSLQATADAGYVAEVASCKNPPKPFRINFPATGPGPRDYS